MFSRHITTNDADDTLNGHGLYMVAVSLPSSLNDVEPLCWQTIVVANNRREAADIACVDAINLHLTKGRAPFPLTATKLPNGMTTEGRTTDGALAKYDIAFFYQHLHDIKPEQSQNNVYEHEPISLEHAKTLPQGTILRHVDLRNADGTPQKWHVTSVKSWKRDSSKVLIRVQRGWKQFSTIDQDQLDGWYISH